MTARAVALLAIAPVVSSLGCPGPRRPREPAAEPITLAIGRPGGSLRGVAGNGPLTFAARTSAATTSIEARRGAAIVWQVELAGTGGALAADATLAFAALAGIGAVAGGPVRGEPGAAIVALEAATGAQRWRVAFESSEWVVISALASSEGGVIVGGSFSGSVRARDAVVASGGKSDGFVAKLTAGGEVAWLVRIGGAGPEAVQGVAARDDRIAIAGTFTSGADLLGHPLTPFDDKSPFTDGFVAELDRTGRRRWSATFGGRLAESVVGVAIDGGGRVAVGGNARDVVHIAGADLAAQGPADGLVGWWSKDGTALGAVLLGGPDFDGVRAITAAGEHVIVGGFYSGAMRLGDRAITANGGDDAFLAALDHRGSVVTSWPVSGPGREEIIALASVPGGFIAGVAYTAAIDLAGAALPAPADPMSGAAVLVRPAR